MNSTPTRYRRVLAVAGVGAALVLTTVAPAASVPAPVAPAAPSIGSGGDGGDAALCGYNGCSKHGEVIRVMTRNVFLGADLGPAFRAGGAGEFIEANGEILRQVKATSMPIRSRGLAKEIKQMRPDIVGLQEVALWRTGPVDIDAALKQKPTAQHVYQDFLAMIMKRLNSKKKLYRVAMVKNEFDFEAPADVDGDPTTGFMGADKNGRLTMRDAILVRRNAGIKYQPIRARHYSSPNSFHVQVAGLVNVQVLRGWLSMKVKVRNSPWFRFANTHLEAFDDRTEVPSIRARQAREFVLKTKRGPQPKIVTGDFNSDYPGLVPGDEQAFLVMKRNGYRDRGTTNPMSCCIADSWDLKTGGSKADWDHRVDQVFTATPKRVLGIDAWVTGRSRHLGRWNSDHAGVTSELFVFRRSGLR